MLLYIENKAYPLKTFVVLCQPSDTVARVRAQLLHSLYEIGHSNHQFRLRHKGNYMRDAYTLEEYKILNNAVIKMVPLNDISDWNKDMRFHQSNKSKMEKLNVEDLVQVALKSEVHLLNNREKTLGVFKTILMMQIILLFLSLFTVYWYFFFAYAVVLFIAYTFCPTFTRIGGWVGKNSVRSKEFMIVFGVLTLAMMGVGIALFTLIVIDLKSSSYPTARCSQNVASCFSSAQNTIEEGVCYAYQKQCYERSVWTAVYFCLEILIMLINSIFSWILFSNFKFNVGDRIEYYLMQMRELNQILEAAKVGTTSEKRNAAFELATLATSGDDNKFQIVSEGGLEALISLGLDGDATTQEYATEAITECLTVPAIQDQFVLIGGMRVLTALLNANNLRTVKAAIMAISYVVTDSDENKPAAIADHGLEDLLYACKYTDSTGLRSLSLIYLELADYDDTRVVLTSRNSTIDALLCILKRSFDEETIATSLQTLELLAIEAPKMINTNEDLMKYLLNFPNKTLDKKLQYFAAKLLLQFADSVESCEQLVSQESVVDDLRYYAYASDITLQNVLANILFRMSELKPYKDQLQKNGLIDLLLYLQSVTNERESWSLIERALSNMNLHHDTDSDLNLKHHGSMSSLKSHDDQTKPSFQPRQRTNISVPSSSSNEAGPSGLQ
uniref:uncharacterized protein LOC120331634 isoform X1 n=1 Tax=Styela clava TaxID=7725 RepID=UPI00193ADFCE|nr:uncharacterized protein LOC120331634 isoform X1 [Styela clava]